jgi:hypothetical protein
LRKALAGETSLAEVFEHTIGDEQAAAAAAEPPAAVRA